MKWVSMAKTLQGIIIWGHSFEFGIGHLVVMKGSNINATAWKDILDNCMLTTFWQQFVEDPKLCAQNKVHKGMF